MTWFILILLLALLFFLRHQFPRWKGQAGENFVIKHLNLLDATHYKIFNNILLPSNGHLDSTQIDHVIVSNYGIFCIETKALGGWIFGSTNQNYWTQVIYRYKKQFYNPLRQNFLHTEAIRSLIKSEFPNLSITPLVIFTSADKLKINGTDSVGNINEMMDKIRSYSSPIISDLEKDRICQILSSANIKDEEIRKLHDRGVKN